MAFAHGSNDVANAIGPLAAIVGVVTTGAVASNSAVPPWLLLVGAVGIVVGLATFGYRVMATIGRKITELTPSRGFAAEFAAASTVVVASGTGLPVSTTQTLVGLSDSESGWPVAWAPSTSALCARSSCPGL